MRRILLSTLAAFTLGGTLAGCYAHDDYRDREIRERHERRVYVDRDGREYRHARWHDRDVWQREDGRWYTRDNNDWVLMADVDIR